MGLKRFLGLVFVYKGHEWQIRVSPDCVINISRIRFLVDQTVKNVSSTCDMVWPVFHKLALRITAMAGRSLPSIFSVFTITNLNVQNTNPICADFLFTK